MQQRGDYIDEKVGSILTDLGYTKTRHHDKYKNIQPFWNEEMHRRCMATIFDYGLKEASPKVIYPALREYDASLRPENIKSHLQKYRSNSKANQLEYLHYFERYLRKEKKAAMRNRLLQTTQTKEEVNPAPSSPTSPQQGLAVLNSNVVQTRAVEGTHSPLHSQSSLTHPSSTNSLSSSLETRTHDGLASVPSHQSTNEDEDDQSECFHFQEDPSMAYQVALHDDIISKHSIRQQRMGLDGIDNDNRYIPSLDYDSFYQTASTIESEKPLVANEVEMGNPLFFLQDPDN